MLANPAAPPLELAEAQGFIVEGEDNSGGGGGGDGLEDLCARALAAQPGEVAKYRAGKVNVINKILGWVMRESKGRADAREAKAVLEELLRR